MIAPFAPALIARFGWFHIARFPRQTVPAPRALAPSARRTPAPPVEPSSTSTPPGARAASLGALIDDAGDEAPVSFLGWFDSSHELRAGLQVVELCALPEGVALPVS